MFKSLVVNRRLFVLACIATLNACGGGGSGSTGVPDQQNVSPVGGEVYEITGAGIKGPLAFAIVSVYALDTNFDELYDPTKPVAEGITNAYAEISGLSVSRNAPSDSAPPYVLVVDGTNAIDRNTDTAPVIKKLVTILTRESLAAGQAVYATPYTTLAYQMLRLDVPRFGGNGLQARYYNDLTFSNLAMERIDANINFSWGGGSPGGSINKDKFSARWTGYIEPNFSETYSFHTSTDDGVRLWIDGQLIIDQWHGQAETEFTGAIRLEAGTRYPIVMEYFDDMGGAAAKLSWSSASEAKSIVPKTNLFSGGAAFARGTDPLLATKLSSYNQVIVQRLGFGIPAEVNIYTTPPILTKDTASAVQQQLVVYYRAAIEALAAVLNQMSLATDSNIQTDTLIRDLALDYFSDGIFDATENGAYINGLDINILLQNPMVLDIPNTQYLVSETPSLIFEERAIVGASSDVPFYIDDITFTLYPADLIGSTGSSVSSPTTEFGFSTAPAPTPTVSPSSGTVLNVDFDSHPGGHTPNRMRCRTLMRMRVPKGSC